VYVPSKFSLDEEDAWEVVRDAGAGMLVVASPGGLESVFVPVIVADDRRTIRSHVARANSWWRLINDGMDVLGLFLCASAYVSPSNYPSKDEDAGVVPTWNYVAAEVRGRITVHDDPTWLNDQVRALTEHFEMDRSPAWQLLASKSTSLPYRVRPNFHRTVPPLTTTLFATTSLAATSPNVVSLRA
jgi:transcriptional regulator